MSDIDAIVAKIENLELQPDGPFGFVDSSECRTIYKIGYYRTQCPLLAAECKRLRAENTDIAARAILECQKRDARIAELEARHGEKA